MDYPCAKFGDFSFSCFGFIAWTDRETDNHRQTESHTDGDDHTTPPASVITATPLLLLLLM